MRARREVLCETAQVPCGRRLASECREGRLSRRVDSSPRERTPGLELSPRGGPLVRREDPIGEFSPVPVQKPINRPVRCLRREALSTLFTSSKAPSSTLARERESFSLFRVRGGIDLVGSNSGSHEVCYIAGGIRGRRCLTVIREEEIPEKCKEEEGSGNLIRERMDQQSAKRSLESNGLFVVRDVDQLPEDNFCGNDGADESCGLIALALEVSTSELLMEDTNMDDKDSVTTSSVVISVTTEPLHCF
ncbi:hypothetical protein KSP39_PZI021725 [Platanthera zijinensis]|uniref:Uncharacterized protein n=1 Tax=Platanthera zijinensis TaxID=2320716 RepID=A0AAP0AYV4_9ASPA